MIKPTIGRVVWFHPAPCELSAMQVGHAMVRHTDQPFEAHVVHVWSDTCVNLVVFDHDGNMHKRTSVPINVENMGHPLGSYADWMPYQVGQAAKHSADDAKK